MIVISCAMILAGECVTTRGKTGISLMVMVKKEAKLVAFGLKNNKRRNNSYFWFKMKIGQYFSVY